MSGKKWPVILLVLLLVAAVVLFIFRDTIAVYMMPKLVLSKALTNAVDQLYSRYSQSPVSLLSRHLESEGLYTAQMNLTTENDLAGEITYDMTVQADLETNQLLAQGLAGAGGKDLDLSLYLNREFMAVSSRNLLNGAYYGICYDTFPEDIRSIPLLSLLVGETVLSGWDASVAGIADLMSQSYKLPEFPEISQEELQDALMAVLLLPSDVNRVQMKVRGVYEDVYRITYRAEGEQVRQILGHLIDAESGSDAGISVTFYLYENEITMLQMHGSAGDSSIRCALELMCDTPDTIALRIASHENGEDKEVYLRHSALLSGGILNETWVTCADFEGEEEQTTFAYRWDSVSGDLVISAEQPVALNLMETDNGLRIQTSHFERLFSMLTRREHKADGNPVSCTMLLQTGADLREPAYKNLDTWSMDDLIVLLGGLGSLFGLKIG